mgnify:CR=1 FL=1
MCLAVPGIIVSIDRAWAQVDVMGILNAVNVLLIDEPAVGDCVLIHAGCAIQKISSDNLSYLSNILSEFLIKEEKNG